MTTWATICDTGKRPGWEGTGMERTDAEALADLIEAWVDGTAIVGYAGLHRAKETGQVSYRGWPLGVTGHFVSRQPPPPVGE